ncbi:MAG: lytic murein transglycosylase [Gemmatimonadota bacterium]
MRRLLRRSAPRPAAARALEAGPAVPASLRRLASRATRPLAYSALAALLTIGPAVSRPHPEGSTAPPPAGTPKAPAAAAAGARAAGARAAAAQAAAQTAFSQIILPDVVVIEPQGLSPAQVARLGRLTGVRRVLAVDGARIRAGGQPVNVLGVDPQQFRSWTPLRTASDSRLWSALDSQEFVASQSLRHRLHLQPGSQYRLSGAAAQDMAFGGSGQFGVAGIDVVVSNRASAGLGLVHNVAALVSAPGVNITTLVREVRAVAGHGGRVTNVRPQQLPVDQAAASGRPATYLDLFKVSAARYCPGMSWTVLAAIGQIESGDGANMGPSTAGALGPMQFMPSTWAMWGITAFGEAGPPNVMDPYDAVPSAARYLCASGAATPAGLYSAIFAYNHADWYVREVLALARQYALQYG